MSKVSIILPTYNESENIVPLIKEIISKLIHEDFEIIVVDDKSPDGTGLTARKKFSGNKKIKVFIRDGRGLAGAVLFGIRKSTGTIVTVMDTDFNHDPKEIKKMIILLQKYDIVIGSRYVKGGGMENRFRNLFSRLYNTVLRYILRIPVHDALSGFFTAKKERISNLLTDDLFVGYGEYFMVFIHKARELGLTITEIPVYYKNRTKGRSKSNFVQMFFNYSKTAVNILSK